MYTAEMKQHYRTIGALLGFSGFLFVHFSGALPSLLIAAALVASSIVITTKR